MRRESRAARQGIALVAGLAIALISSIATARGERPLAGLRIHDIQGASQLSPIVGRQVVAVPGLVTAVSKKSLIIQDPDGDGNPATSEAVVVYTDGPPRLAGGDRPAVGDAVQVSGTVVEHFPGGNHKNLPTTEISVNHDGGIRRIARPRTVFSHTTITPVVLGAGGRAFPTEYIEDHVHGNLAKGNRHPFDPARDGIDFYESLESMQVRVNNAQVVGPTNQYGELYVVADRGTRATGINARGGITVVDRGDHVDDNPERLEIAGRSLAGRATTPAVNVGAVFDHITGTLDYAYGQFELRPVVLPMPQRSLLRPERAAAVASERLTVATYNVENLDPNDHDGDEDVADGKFDALASQIVRRLKSPDIIALQEIQDNDGSAAERGIISADRTLSRLVAAIAATGGPHYAFTEIAPIAGTNGGEPGGNIRPAFLYRPSRVALVDVGAKGDARSAVQVARDKAGQISLSANPGLVAPGAKAFRHSRKPLAALFSFHGQRILLIDNHFTAKIGSTALYGAIQPPTDGGQVQRMAQADLVHRFIAKALAAVPNAQIAALGDFNAFAFEPPLRHLTGADHGLVIGRDLLERLPPTARYTYIYQGNAQAIDHVFATDALRQRVDAVRIVHLNTEFANPASDHDPVRLVFSWSVGGHAASARSHGPCIAPVDARGDPAPRLGC